MRLARRITALDELAENIAATTALLAQSPAKVLLEKIGIGPVTAAVAMAAWSHDGRVPRRGRVRLASGVSPIPASSGNTVRHRLNRGGDRRLNRALHMAVVTRMAYDPTTAHTPNDAPQKDSRRRRSAESSSATSHGRSTAR